jgi:hypothetical protein
MASIPIAFVLSPFIFAAVDVPGLSPLLLKRRLRLRGVPVRAWTVSRQVGRHVSKVPNPDMAMQIARKKRRPKAASYSNPMIPDQAVINAGFDFRRYAIKPTPAKPRSIIAHVEDSGTGWSSWRWVSAYSRSVRPLLLRDLYRRSRPTRRRCAPHLDLSSVALPRPATYHLRTQDILDLPLGANWASSSPCLCGRAQPCERAVIAP